MAGMYCLLTVRQLKPGTYEDFRRAWQPERFPDPFVKAYLLRNQEDPDEVTSFGFFDATAEEVENLRDDPEFARSEVGRMQRIAECGLGVRVNGI